MKHFRTGQRVIVTAEHHPLFERRGKVVALQVSGPAAVVAIEGGLEDHVNIILDGQPYPDRTLLLPHQCEEAQ